MQATVLRLLSSGDTKMEINGINEDVFKEYEAVRQSGLTNMFDKTRVLQIAKKARLNHLALFIKENDYADILRNYSKAKELGVLEK